MADAVTPNDRVVMRMIVLTAGVCYLFLCHGPLEVLMKIMNNPFSEKMSLNS